MWSMLIAGLALAAEPEEKAPKAEKAPKTEKSERSGKAPAAEGEAAGPALEAALALTLPTSGLGAGPGLRVAGDTHLGKLPEALRIGAELDLGLPRGHEGTVTDPSLASGLDYHARRTTLGLGAKADWTLGDPEGVHGRVGLGLGLAFLFQGTEAPAGTSRERATTLWLRPQGGVLVPAGPGFVTGSLLVGITPIDLLVVDAPLSVALAAGYRVPF